MSDKLITLNDQLKLSVLVVLISGYLLYKYKPRLLFKENGEFKHFGVNNDETPFPFFMVLIVIGFTSYYGLLLKEGKYV